MPVLEFSYKLEQGEREIVLPFSRIAYLSKNTMDGITTHYLHTMSAEKLYIGESDYNRIHEAIIEQEGVQNDNDLHHN